MCLAALRARGFLPPLPEEFPATPLSAVAAVVKIGSNRLQMDCVAIDTLYPIASVSAKPDARCHRAATARRNSTAWQGRNNVTDIGKRLLLQGLAAGSAYGMLGGPLGGAFAQTPEKPRYGGHLRTSYALEPTHARFSHGEIGRRLLLSSRDARQPDFPRSPRQSRRRARSPRPGMSTCTARDDLPSAAPSAFHDGTPFNAEGGEIQHRADPGSKDQRHLGGAAGAGEIRRRGR